MATAPYFQMADKGWFFTIRTDTGNFSVNHIGDFDGHVVQRRGGCYVVKTKGNRNNPARFVVWKLVDETKSGLLISGHANILVDFPIRAPIRPEQINWETPNRYINE